MKGKLKNIFLLTVLSVGFGNCFAQNSFYKGKAYLDGGQNDSALVYFDKALTEGSKPENVFFNKGMALYSLSQYRMAITEFEKVENTTKGKASVWIAKCYANLRETENCLKALDVHLNSNYRLPESQLLLDPDLKKIENDPAFIEFWKNGNWYNKTDQVLADADYEIKLKQYPDAINILTDGLNKGYRKAPLYAKRAQVYLAVNNYKLALEDLDQAILLDKRNSDWLATRGQINFLTGKYKSAVEDFQTALRLNPEETKYNIGLAMSLSKAGQYDEAVKDLRFYLDLYPKNDSAWYQLGKIHYDNGNYFEAINSFNSALKLTQNDYRFFAARGATYLKTRTYQYAWKDLAMALDLNPKDVDSYLNKGIAALNTGKKDDACFCFDMAKKLGSKEGFNMVEKYCK